MQLLVSPTSDESPGCRLALYSPHSKRESRWSVAKKDRQSILFSYLVVMGPNECLGYVEDSASLHQFDLTWTLSPTATMRVSLSLLTIFSH